MTPVADQLVTALGVIAEAEELAEKWESELSEYPDHDVRARAAALAIHLCAEELSAVLRGKENDG